MRERFEVFCSYARVDKAAVTWLVEALEAHGLAVYLDRHEILDFAGITASIERGLSRSKVLLAYYSASYPTRRACQWELTAAYLAAQRAGDPRLRVLVVNPEESAGHIEPIELRDALFRAAPDVDDQQGFAALADSVAGRVTELEGLLGEVQPLVPPAWHPDQRAGSSRFVGRMAEMWAVHSALQAAGVGVITGAVTAVAQLRGLAGVGKSLLAEEYALRFGASYPGGVFWLRGFGHGEGSLDSEQREAERQRQLGVFAARVGISARNLSAVEVEGALGRWLEAQGEPCLWVVDDLPAGLEGEVRAWLAPHPIAKTLITTRSREYDALGRHTDLGELPELEAVELLTKRRRPQGDDERAAAKAIADELGCHPLALDVAAAAIRYQAFVSFLSALLEPSDDWLERLTADLYDALPNGHERSIARTLSRSIDRLGDEGLDFLRLAASLAAAPVSAAIVSAVLAKVDGLDERRAAERELRALDQVRSSSLVEDVGELAWRVHPLVCRTVRFTDPAPERREALRQAAVTTLSAELRTLVEVGSHSRPEGAVPHARELVRRASHPEELRLLGWLARYDHKRGDDLSASGLFRRQYEAMRELLGDEHPGTLTSLNNVAVTLLGRGDLAGARRLHERALEARQRVLGDEHLDTLQSLNNLANTLRAHGDFAGARHLHGRALKVRRRVLGDEHADTLSSLNNLANTLQDEYNFAGARRLHERALEARRRVLGDEHPDTLQSLNNLANALLEQGEVVEARELHEQALAGRRRVLGDEHPTTLSSFFYLAETLRAQGNLAAARRLHERALEACRRVHGDLHPSTLSSLTHLAETLRAQGDVAGARALHERALEGRRTVLGEEHHRTLTSLNYLAETLRAQGDLAGARHLHERALEARRKVLGDEDLDTLESLDNLASTLEMQGDLPAARGLRERAAEARRRGRSGGGEI